MGRKGRLILVISASVFLIAVIITLVVLIATSVDAGYSSYPAESGTYKVTFRTKGYIFKDDVQLTSDDSDKTVVYVYEGDSVEKGEVIARVYPSATSAQISELSEICMKIDKYSKTAEYLNLSMSETEALMADYTSKANNSSDLRTSSYYSYLFDILKLRHDLFYSVNSDYTYELMALEEQKKLTEQKMGASKDIVSNYNGTFSSFYDGYESLLLPSSVSKLEKLGENYLAPFNSHVENDIFGVLTQGEVVHCVCMIEDNGFDLTKIEEIYISGSDVPVKVKTNIVHKNESDTLVDFEISVQDYVSGSRNVIVDALKETITGFKIQKKDIYDIKGTSCVYIDEGGVAKIREVCILTENGEYIIVNGDKVSKYPALLNGEMILTGVDRVYNGKKLK